MRISSRVGLIIIGVAIVAALLALYFAVYLPQAAERDDLIARQDRAEVLQSQLSASKTDLEGELASARSSLDASKTQYPQEIHSIEYGEHIFEIIEESNLRLPSLAFPKPSGSKQGPVTYSAVSLTLPVSGTVESIFRLIDIIKTDPRFASTSVNSVNLNVGGGSATISVTIYGYRG
jgi:hypothetical protein